MAKAVQNLNTFGSRLKQKQLEDSTISAERMSWGRGMRFLAQPLGQMTHVAGAAQATLQPGLEGCASRVFSRRIDRDWVKSPPGFLKNE
jgi:hypothetical protein